MTTVQYRWAVGGQIAALCVLGLVSLSIILGAVPSCRSKGHLEDAIEHYSLGTESELREANEALELAQGVDAAMPGALALRGRIAVEEGNLAVAADSYETSIRVLPPTERGPALNGLGCVKLLEVMRGDQNREQLLEEARQKFDEAIQEDQKRGDAQINAAICALHINDLEQAAAHLRHARTEPQVSYDSVISYYSALASVLWRAAAAGPGTARAVAETLADRDEELADRERMFTRAETEFQKAASLAYGRPVESRLGLSTALVQAELLAVAEPAVSVALERRDRRGRLLKRKTAPLRPGVPTLSLEKASRYWDAVSKALSDHKEFFARRPRSRQVLCLILGISRARFGRLDVAAAWVRRAIPKKKKDQKKREPVSPVIRFHVGAALFHVAHLQKKAGKTQKEVARQLEEAAVHLEEALEATRGLTPCLRFVASVQLAVAKWNADDCPGALDYMKDAQKTLAQSKSARRGIRDKDKARFYRNLGIMQYRDRKRPDAAEQVPAAVENRRVMEAVENLTESLRLDGTQEDLRRFRDRIKTLPEITDVRIAKAEKVPPSVPLITAAVQNKGPVRFGREDIRVRIQGKEVTFFCGPDGRIYALPREGDFFRTGAQCRVEITIAIDVQGRGKRKVQKTNRLTVVY